jgi:hypothetical protein
MSRYGMYLSFFRNTQKAPVAYSVIVFGSKTVQLLITMLKLVLNVADPGC